MSTIKSAVEAFAKKHADKLKSFGIKLEGIAEQVEMKLIGKLADGTEVYSNADSLAEGVDVFIRDAEGKDIPAPVGEHILEDGTAIIIETEGIVKSVKVKEEEEEMTAEQIQQNMDTLIGKIEEQSAEIETLKAQLADKSALEDEVKQLKIEVLKLKKTPAATSVKQEKQATDDGKSDDVKVGSREYFKRIAEKQKSQN